MTKVQNYRSSELLESRPERVLRSALRRESIEIGKTKLFFSVVPADTEVISSHADFVYPNAGEPDRRGRELAVREPEPAEEGAIEESIKAFIRSNPAEFPSIPLGTV